MHEGLATRKRSTLSIPAFAFSLLSASAVAFADHNDEAAIEFFERRVRPVLVEHCMKCHGSEAQKGELRLDARAELLRGGSRGPAVKPGEPRGSLLVRAVRRRGELKMPPTGALKATEIADLERWIERGAMWPEGQPLTQMGGSADRAARIERLRNEHWAFKPVVKPTLPDIEDTVWVRQPLDRFILARLEHEGMSPSDEADRRTLVRRLYFDLIGLPPPYQVVEAFVADESPTAYEKLVDDLLGKIEYGERWARHWLDVARYADTTGYQEGGEPQFPFAWSYRDYVVRTFNEDVPFDEFIVEQLAADQLDLADKDRWKLAAMGFLTLGPRFNYVRHEIIDDRIDVVTRSLLGLTVTCARCHDHKYDPILADDYYGLYGVFASSREPLYSDLPRVDQSRGDFGRYRQFRLKVARATRRFEQFHTRVHRALQHEMRALVGDYLRYLVQLMPEHRTVAQPSFDTNRGHIRGPTPYGPGGIVRWKHYVASRGEDDPVFGVWNQLAKLTRGELPERVSEVIAGAENTNPLLRSALRDKLPSSMLDVASIYGEVLGSVYADWTELREVDLTAERLADDGREELRQILYADDSPAAMNKDEAHDCYTDGEFNEYMGLKRELDSLFLEYQDVAEPRAMVLADRAEPEEPRVFARGVATRPGRPVPRRFLRVLDNVDSGKPFAQGSGRLELAQAIIHPDNPLTARVIVNRVWQGHFGRGLVETASDFGTRGDPPSHPQLLDWLAADFVKHGWSLKRLHKQIVTSSTYRQTSLTSDLPARRTESGESVDTDNRLLWRMNRRRLEFEALRDSLLAVSGGLERSKRGGPPVEDFDVARRSLYLLIDRHDLSSTLATFDFPSPDISISRRSATTVPPQALFLMNSEFASRMAGRLADQVMDAGHDGSARDRIEWLYRRILSRDPDNVELTLCEKNVGLRSEDGFRDLAHALLMSNEFMFVD